MSQRVGRLQWQASEDDTEILLEDAVVTAVVTAVVWPAILGAH